MPGGMNFDRGRWQFGQGNKPIFLNDLTQDEEVIAVLEAAIIAANPDSLTEAEVTALATSVATSVSSAAVANLVDAAPTTLDTLNELAAALGDDANFATTIANQLALKASTASIANMVTSTTTVKKLHGPITQAAYNAIATPAADTLYVIVG